MLRPAMTSAELRIGGLFPCWPVGTRCRSELSLRRPGRKAGRNIDGNRTVCSKNTLMLVALRIAPIIRCETCVFSDDGSWQVTDSFELYRFARVAKALRVCETSAFAVSPLLSADFDAVLSVICLLLGIPRLACYGASRRSAACSMVACPPGSLVAYTPLGYPATCTLR